MTLIECALGHFPYTTYNSNNNNNNNKKTTSTFQPNKPGEFNMGFWEIMDYIVKEPPPVLPADRFSPELCDFASQW